MLKISVRLFSISLVLALVLTNNAAAAFTGLKNKSTQNNSGVRGVQAVEANQPTFKEKGDGIGNLKALEFDGTNDFVTIDGNSLIGNDYTIFMVEKRGESDDHNYFLSSRVGYDGTTTQSGANHLYGIRIGHAADNTFIFQHGGTGNVVNYTQNSFSSSDLGTIHTMRFSNSDGLSYYRDGALVGTNDLSGVVGDKYLLGNEDLAIGADNLNATPRYYKGKFAELAVYKRALGADEINTIQRYLSDKYRVDVSEVKEDVEFCGPSTTGLASPTANSTWSATLVAEGASINTVCNNTFVLSGPPNTLTCTNGAWVAGVTGTTCDVGSGMTCSSPPSNAGVAWTPIPTADKQVAAPACQSGFQALSGLPDSLFCDNGTYINNPGAQTCTQVCNESSANYVTPIANGRWIVVTPTVYAESGNSITFGCKNGYNLTSGSMTNLTCNVSGGTATWSGGVGSPVCTLDQTNNCDTTNGYVTPPTNGKWSGIFGLPDSTVPVGTVGTFACEDEYVINGSLTNLTCTSSGWTGGVGSATCDVNPDACTTASNGYVAPPTGGQLERYSEPAFGDYEYECTDGHNQVGSLTDLDCSGGVWTGGVGTMTCTTGDGCHSGSTGYVAPPANATWKNFPTLHGANARAECNSGFSETGGFLPRMDCVDGTYTSNGNPGTCT